MQGTASHGYRALLALALALLCSPALAQQEFVIVQPNAREPVSPYHADDAPNHVQSGWLALIYQDGVWYLKPTTLQIRRETDPVLDDEGMPPTGVVIGSKEYPDAQLLLRHPALQPGKVSVPLEGARQLYAPRGDKYPNGQRLLTPFGFYGQTYWLELFENIHAVSVGASDSDAYILTDRLFMHTTRPQKPSMIIPRPEPRVDWGESYEDMLRVMEKNAAINSIWVGDLDHDGLPDLVIYNSGINHSGACLYLSSLAPPAVNGSLPGRAGCQITTGC